MVPEKTVRAVLDRAAELNGGAPLGENAAPLAVTAIRRALAFCQRTDVPEEMEQAVAALLLALLQGLPQGTDAGENSAAGWEALLDAGAVKSIQRGDTAITFHSGGASSILSGSGTALEGLKPWRRLGRLKGGG